MPPATRTASARLHAPAPPAGHSRASATGIVLVFLTGVLIFLAGFHSIVDADVWFHLRAGSQVASGSIPRTDTFSYPSAGRPYLDLHWLFQWLAYNIYRLAGEPGLIWMVCLVITATFALLYRLARRYAPAPLAAGLTALGGILASERFEPRPEILTFLFFVLVCWLARRQTEGSKRAWWMIPLVTLLWVNTESI